MRSAQCLSSNGCWDKESRLYRYAESGDRNLNLKIKNEIDIQRSMGHEKCSENSALEQKSGEDSAEELREIDLRNSVRSILLC